MDKVHIKQEFEKLKIEAQEIQSGVGRNISTSINELMVQIENMQNFSETCDAAPLSRSARGVEQRLCHVNTEISRLLQNNRHVATSQVFALNEFMENTVNLMQNIEDFVASNCSCKRK